MVDITLDCGQTDRVVAESMKKLLTFHVLNVDEGGEFVNDFDFITSIETILRYFLPITEADSFISEVYAKKITIKE